MSDGDGFREFLERSPEARQLFDGGYSIYADMALASVVRDPMESEEAWMHRVALKVRELADRFDVI